MPSITNANHAAQLDTSRRSYISTAVYKTTFYSYTPATIDGAGNAVAGYLTAYSSGADVDFPARRVLRETGKKLFPGVHSGVSTYMVSVYDSVKMWNGFIDPNSHNFAVYNTDKSHFLPADTTEIIPTVVASGSASLVSGTVTVSTAAAKSDSLVFVSYKTPGGTMGANLKGTATNGSIIITAVDASRATVATDTSLVNWMIIN